MELDLAYKNPHPVLQSMPQEVRPSPNCGPFALNVQDVRWDSKPELRTTWAGEFGAQVAIVVVWVLITVETKVVVGD